MTRIRVDRTRVPPLPAGHVPRPALAAAARGTANGRPLVVVAPAGAGKTTLLAESVHADRITPTAWATLGPADADPASLWTVLAAALVAADGGPGARPGPARRAVLEALRSGFRLVLDDVHVLAGSPAAAALGSLVRSCPVGGRLVLAGRSDVVGAAAGPTRRLSAGDLRFDPAETAAVLAAGGTVVGEDVAAAVHRRTGGWAVGVRLAALASAPPDGDVGALARFPGTEPAVADYVEDELLAALGPADRTLLHDVACCGRLPAPLVAALTGRADAATRLGELGRGTGLLDGEPTDGYRVLPVLRRHLDAVLARDRPDRHRARHATAARWWADRGEAGHALAHAERADDPALTAALLGRLAPRLVLGGDHTALRRALRHTGGLPGAAPAAALAEVLAGDPGAAADHLRPVAPRPPEPVVVAVRDLVAALRGGPAVRRPDGAGPGAPDHVALGLLAEAARAGAGAAPALEAAIALAREHDLPGLAAPARSWLAVLALLDGDPVRAGAAADRAAAAARAASGLSGWEAVPDAVRAAADLLRGDPDAAGARSAAALDGPGPLPPQVAHALHVVRAAAGTARDRTAAGPEAVRATRAALGGAPLPAAVAGLLASLEHRAALTVGDGRAAEAVVARLRDRTGSGPAVDLARAWSAAAAGRHRAVLAAVASLRHVRSGEQLEVRLLEAEAAWRTGDADRGRRAAAAAVALGRARDLVAPFALAGPLVREHLADLAGRPGGDRDSWAERVAAVVGPGAPAPLSERELVVLARLPSLLTLPEIAEELVVSVNTVKTQLRAVYAKLGVATRREAVARAGERGLLVPGPSAVPRPARVRHPPAS